MSSPTWRTPRDYAVADLAARRSRCAPLIVVLDGIEDPHNVGAILRTADAAGVTGVVRQTRHAAALDGVVGKASAGALALARIATVVNIARALEELEGRQRLDRRSRGEASDVYTDVDWTLPSALVLGAEGSGLRRLVRERCDRLVRIPMYGRGGEPERVRGGRGRLVRGGAPARVERGWQVLKAEGQCLTRTAAHGRFGQCGSRV